MIPNSISFTRKSQVSQPQVSNPFMQKLQQDQQQQQRQIQQSQFVQFNQPPAQPATFQSPFQSIAQPQQPKPTFGSPFQAQQPQQTQFGFAQTIQPTQSNLFSQLVQKTASQPVQQPAFTSMNQNGFQMMSTNNSFANIANQSQTNASFGANVQNNGFNGSFFNNAQPQMNQTGAFSTGAASVGPYSNMNELSDQEMKEFNSSQFTIGRVPNNPPPQNLC